MKNSLRILLSILAITSTMAFAVENTVEKEETPKLSLEKFSYYGVGFKSNKNDLVAKSFVCNEESCKRKENATNVTVIFTGNNIQRIETQTRYSNHIDCEGNQEDIKRYLTDAFNFHIVNKERYFLGRAMGTSDINGNITTQQGVISVNVSCTNDPKINISYVNTQFNLKDISFQNFKDALKYE